MPASILLAVVLTGLGFLCTPRSWIFLLPDPPPPDGSPGHAGPRRWLTILPPPELEIVRVDPPEPRRSEARPQPEPEDPRWWTEGWRIRTVTATDLAAAPPDPAVQDSVQTLLELLGAPADLLTAAKPDSALASFLFFRRMEDSFEFDELKPYIAAMGRAEVYRNIMARAAELYGQFLKEEIRTPD